MRGRQSQPNARPRSDADGRKPSAPADALRRYREKRDFHVTPEPRGRVARSAGNGRFVVQKHAARRLHYDFRLELDGTLKSWAVPKGPSLDPTDKRLAVHVEDHPLDYASFEGEIPQDQYGAGRVLLWDEGTWEPKGDAAADYRAGRLKFKLHGHKLRGSWNLLRMGNPAQDGKENWLLIKERDEEALSDGEADITARAPRSVATNRLLEEVGGRGEAQWHSNPSGEQATPATKRAPSLMAKPNGWVRPIAATPKGRLPDTLEPQLATLVDRAPTDAGWVYEIKYDGYRMLTRISRGKARLFTRNADDWTARLPELAQALARLPVQEAWLDGEITALEPNGKSGLQALQQAIGEPSSAGSICYYLFDLLFLDGHDLRTTPLVQRKARLAELLSDAPNSSSLRFSEHVEAPGNAFHEQACLHGLEGVVGKRRDSGYISGRSRTWIKLKCRNRQEFVIAGFTEPGGARKGPGALLLGVHDEQGRLQFAGKVGTGPDGPLLHDLRQRLVKLEQDTSPFAEMPSRQIARTARWIRPELVAEVSFTGWTGDNVVRQASFEGLREDQPPGEVIHETPVSGTLAKDRTSVDGAIQSSEPEPAGARDNVKSRTTRAPQVAGVVLSNADRVMFPSRRFTKLDVARYYEAVAEWILPHLKGRPLSLVRCPAGARGQCFFQKHLHEKIPEELTPVELEEAEGTGTYVIANSVAAVVRLVQLGVLELHTWGSPYPEIDKPDRIIFDLDPDPTLHWDRVVEAAHLVRALLHDLDLESFPKTSGGKGLHLVVPLQRRHSWEEVKSFSRAIAEHLAHMLPGQFTSRMTKAMREKRVYLDYLRNARGATAVAAFSPRARPGATVSVPLAWEEVMGGTRSDQFNIGNVPARLAKLREDPWLRYWNLGQSITASMKATLGMVQQDTGSSDRETRANKRRTRPTSKGDQA